MSIDLEKLKKDLEQQKKTLQQELARLKNAPDFGDDIDSLEEEMDESQGWGNRMALREEIKNKLIEIDRTLRRIETGKYGICQKCGKKISEEILKINPLAKLCKDCIKSSRK